VYICTNNKLLQQQPNANPTTSYQKYMLSKDLMSDVGESTNESNLSSKDPIVLDEPNEDEVEHEPLEFPHDDKIPFSRLFSDLMVWQM